MLKKPPLAAACLCFALFACSFFCAREASAAREHDNTGKRVTAADVTGSAESVRKFVLHAKEHWEVEVASEESFDLWHEILDEIRNPGDWNAGSQYLIMVDKQGRCIAHGHYKSAHSRNLSGLRDARGNDVIKKLIEAAQSDPMGGSVEYYWDDPQDPSDSADSPKSAYAVNYEIDALGLDVVLIGGFDHDESFIPTAREVLKKYMPEVRASSVKDKETLKIFVEKAVEFVNDVYKSTEGNMDIVDLLVMSSRDDAWRHESVYLFAMTKQGLVVFNANNPDLMKSSSMNNILDKSGIVIGEEVLKVAESGGGFVQYFWDNPLVEGDETGELDKSPGTSLKISYVKKVKLGDRTYILGSGIYPTKKNVYADDAEDSEGFFAAETLSKAVIVCMVLLLLFCAVWWQKVSDDEKKGRR